VVRYRCDEDLFVPKPIQNRVGKTIQHKSALASPAGWVSERRLQDSRHRVIDLKRKRLSGYLASCRIPVTRFAELLGRFAMKS
jgi:hypothetical protein